ncbi:MAG TPA: hypothetical protein VJU61_14995 [Polyangiaceae bacterium]|nr:hypothetical protein [Polyangiaceae bacterium]
MPRTKKTSSQPPASSPLRRGAEPGSSAAGALGAGSFDALLRKTIGLSRSPGTEASDPDALAGVLRELEPEAALKLRILMLAGREGRDIGAIHGALTSGDKGTSADKGSADKGSSQAALELGRIGAELGEWLSRGHAIACATQFDLEAPLARWAVAERSELEERVWLRFGRQLAMQPIDEWECLGATGGGAGDSLAKLYLRLGKTVWWSFGAVIDRPSPAAVKSEARRQTGKKAKLGRLRDIPAHGCQPDRRALRRAIRAIRARVGA